MTLPDSPRSSRPQPPPEVVEEHRELCAELHRHSYLYHVEARPEVSDAEFDDLRFAWRVVANTKSNAVVVAKGGAAVGIGAGDQSNVAYNSLRNRSLDRTLAQVDIRHAFKFDGTFDLPFGKGRRFASSSNWASNAFFGGWTIAPSMRWQSGAPIMMEDVQIVGMTAKELQKSVGVYYNQVINGVAVPVSYLPADIIVNTIRAFTFATPSATNATGYPVGGAPSGRFIAPAGYANCQQRSLGECGTRKFILYGPSFYKLDASVLKKIAIGERRNVELRATFFDVLNRTNWRIGNWTGNVNNITAFTGTFGQLGNGTSYQDPSGSNDPGGRLIDFMIRINF